MVLDYTFVKYWAVAISLFICASCQITPVKDPNIVLDANPIEEDLPSNEDSLDKIVPEGKTDQVVRPKTDTIKSNMPKQEIQVSRDFLMGKYRLANQKLFSKIDKTYANTANRYMHKEAYDAFKKMYEAAKKEGIKLQIVSAARPYHQQKAIWSAKWTGKRKVDGENLAKAIPSIKERALKILEYSSMPGTSRHHWGTDIDINNLNNSYFEKGKGKQEYDWLVANAANFGFHQPYTQKGAARPNGYEEEKWHWSYLPLAQPYLNQYLQEITIEDITALDFAGAKSAAPIQVIEHYVLGIAENCK